MRRSVAAAALVAAAAIAAVGMLASSRSDRGRDRQDRAERNLRSVTLPAPPVALAAGDHRVWVVTTSTSGRPFGELFAVDPRTLRITGHTRVGAEPTALAVTDGAVWITHGTAERQRRDSVANTLLRIDPRSATVIDRFAVGEAQDIEADRRGVWLVRRARGGSVLERRTAATGRLEFSVRVEGLARQGALALGGGSLWALTTTYSSHGTRSEVTRIDPDRGLVRAVARLPAVGRAIAYGARSLFATANRDGRHVRGALVEISGDRARPMTWPTALPSARDLAFAGGAVWVSGGASSVFGVDAMSRRVRLSITVGGSSEQVAAGVSGVWTLDPLRRRVVRVVPPFG